MRVSKTAGRVTLRSNESAMSYVVATGNLFCSGCDRLMPSGERFTRSKMAGGGAATFPMCQECRPFISSFKPSQIEEATR